MTIGLGHDAARFFRSAVTIVDAGERAGTMRKKRTERFRENAAAAWVRNAAENGRQGGSG